MSCAPCLCLGLFLAVVTGYSGSAHGLPRARPLWEAGAAFQAGGRCGTGHVGVEQRPVWRKGSEEGGGQGRDVVSTRRGLGRGLGWDKA